MGIWGGNYNRNMYGMKGGKINLLLISGSVLLEMLIK